MQLFWVHGGCTFCAAPMLSNIFSAALMVSNRQKVGCNTQIHRHEHVMKHAMTGYIVYIRNAITLKEPEEKKQLRNISLNSLLLGIVQ
jgi:hypothetical protein